MREAMLALLAKEPAHGYELRQRLAAGVGAGGRDAQPGAGVCDVVAPGAGGPGPGGAGRAELGAGQEGVRGDRRGSGRGRGVAAGLVVAEGGAGRVPSQAGRGGRDRVGRPGGVDRCPAPRADAAATGGPAARRVPARRATAMGCCCWRARRYGCRPTSAGSRRARSGGPGGRDERGRASRGAAAPLPGRWRAGACRRRRRSGRRPGRGRVDHGAERLRQVHPAAPAGWAGATRRRHADLGRPAGRPVVGGGMGQVAAPHDRLRVPGVPPCRRAHRRRERRAPGAAGRYVPTGGTAPRDRAARTVGRGRSGGTPARPALRRRAASGWRWPGR